MSTVFFKINEIQGREVEEMMQEEGYTNKAEFFRFLIKYYKYSKPSAVQKFELAASELGNVLKKLDQNGKLTTSLNEQLADV